MLIIKIRGPERHFYANFKLSTNQIIFSQKLPFLQDSNPRLCSPRPTVFSTRTTIYTHNFSRSASLKAMTLSDTRSSELGLCQPHSAARCQWYGATCLQSNDLVKRLALKFHVYFITLARCIWSISRPI